VERGKPLQNLLILRRHQPGIVAERVELAREVMGTNARFPPGEAWRQIGADKRGMPIAIQAGDKSAAARTKRRKSLIASII